jgi:antigen flippase
VIAALAHRTRWLIRGRSTTAAVLQTTVLQVATLVLNFGTGILTARLLAPAGRGELAAINLVPTLLGYLLTFGVPTAVLYNLRRSPQDSPRLIGAAFVLTAVFGLAAVAAGYVIMPYTLHQYSEHTVAVARIFLLTAPISIATYVCTNAFDSAGNFWYGNGTKFLSPLITLICLCAFWASGRLDVLTAAVSYALPSLPVGIKMVLDTKRHYRPVFLTLTAGPFKQLLSYGLRSYGVDLLRTIGSQVDQVLVIAFLTPAAMGLYAVALAVSRILQIFQSSVVRVLLPHIAARSTAEVVPAVGRATRITAALTAPLSAGLIVLAPWLLHLTYGGKFEAAEGVLRILALEALFAGATWILAQAFLALGKPATVTALQAIGLALSVPLMLVLIPRFGLLGAGMALMLSTVVRLVLVILSFPWLLGIAPPGLLLTRADIESLRRRLRRNVPADDAMR